MRRRRQTGRHIAYAQRSGSVVAIVGEVEIDRRTGKVRARRFTGTHDRRLIINPDGLRRCIEGNVVQGTSRALSEEVAFDRAKGHQRRLALIPDPRHHRGARGGRYRAAQPPRIAAGRCRRKLDPPVAAALANAVFDASGLCLRRAS
ncbi:MAG TPA: molybdopterin cofactor-binding domain-containing protein [Stellaceae bacterium]|nr:molybdopterin cofactor-binding domain-containing protein [Stellaceae bacterium]